MQIEALFHAGSMSARTSGGNYRDRARAFGTSATVFQATGSTRHVTTQQTLTNRSCGKAGRKAEIVCLGAGALISPR